MCSAHKHHIMYTVGLCAMGHCILVRLVMGGFELVGFPWHCWEGLVVDRLPVVDYFLGSGLDYFWPALVGYWGLAS